MAYRSAANGFLGTLIGLGVWMSLADWLGGWVVAGALAAVFGSIWMAEFLRTRRLAAEAQRDRDRPCVHGVVGAVRDHSRCSHCTADDQEREATAEREREAAEALRLEKSRQAFAEWKARVRMPEYLRSVDPRDFELLVCRLFQQIGYEVEATPYSGDNGVDGYLRRDGRLALLQCKRVQGSVGEPVLRDLFGSMHSQGADEGIVVTTGTVSRQARAWATGKPIRIVELAELTSLIHEHIGEPTAVPKWFTVTADPAEVLNECPQCGSTLRVVKGRRGKFLGCSAFPNCRYTRDLPKRRPRSRPNDSW